MKWSKEPRECENPDCKDLFEPHVHNQRICNKKRCAVWKAKENRKKYVEARKAELEARIVRITMPTRGDGCAVGSMLWCPFPGIENW